MAVVDAEQLADDRERERVGEPGAQVDDGVGTCDADRWERLRVLAGELVARDRAAA